MAKMKGTFEEKLAREEAEYLQAKSREEATRLEVEEVRISPVDFLFFPSISQLFTFVFMIIFSS